ncbi:MAG: hypothetical protein ABIO85_06410 [Sphingomicrobium sp.]
MANINGPVANAEMRLALSGNIALAGPSAHFTLGIDGDWHV